MSLKARCQVRYVNLIMERAREKESKRYVSLFISFFIFVFQMGRSQMCRASKSRESIQGPCLAVPSGKPIGLRIFIQCHQGNPSGSSRFLTPVSENTRYCQLRWQVHRHALCKQGCTWSREVKTTKDQSGHKNVRSPITRQGKTGRWYGILPTLCSC